MSPTPRQRPHPELETQPRYVVLASLVEERRVLDIGGDATSLLTLAEAGASEIMACSDQSDALTATLSEAEVEGIEVTAIPSLPLEFGEGAFDLVIFHDLGEWIVEDEQWISELRRVLSPSGYLVLALANPNGQRLSDLCGQHLESSLTYEGAFEKLTDTFGVLTVLVQSPLAANLFYDLESEEEEPDLVFDRSLLVEDTDAAGWYVLVFGAETVHRDDLTIVQIPFSSLARAVGGRDAETALQIAAAPADVVGRLEREKERLAARVSQLKAELEQAAAGDDDATERLEREKEELAAQVRQLKAEVEQAAPSGGNEATERLEREKEKLVAQVDQLKSELEQDDETVLSLEREKESLAAQVSQLKRELERAGQTGDDAAFREREELSQRVAQLESELKQVGSSSNDEAMQALEREKKDLSEHLSRLQGELEQLGERPTAEAVQGLEQEKEGLAGQVAQLQGELEQLGERPTAEAVQGLEQEKEGLAGQVAQLQGELEQLGERPTTETVQSLEQEKESLAEQVGQLQSELGERPT
ncbi:methyltransferase domain-containing protein, partial [Myxococcota bacterium]